MSVGAWGASRSLGEWYVRRAAKRWFGAPEPGAMRLFGKEKSRPIQSFQSLRVPDIANPPGAPDVWAATRKPERTSQARTIRNAWAALADGLLMGASAYAAGVAASPEARGYLASLPRSLDRIGVGDAPISSFTQAQLIGYENWLKGHIGEQVAANVLTAQGHHVTFASTPNQPGWDLIVDGEPVNVKVGESAIAHIEEHFEKYPDVEVLTDIQTAELLDHPLVQGVPGLGAEMIDAPVRSGGIVDVAPNHSPAVEGAETDILHGAQHIGTEDSLEALDGADAAAAGLHVPWVTASATICKEIALTAKHGGSLEESVRIILTDVAAVAIGANIGGVGGSLLGPIGTLCGAVLGAVFGKYIVNGVRRESVENELKRLRPRLEAIDQAWQEATETFLRDVGRVIDQVNAQFKSETEPVRLAYEKRIEELLQRHDEATRLFFESVHDLFSSFYDWLDQDLMEARRLHPERPMWKRLLLPSRSDSARRLAEVLLAKRRIELSRWHDRFASVIANAEISGVFDIAAARELLADFLGTYKIWDVRAAPILKASLDRFNEIARQATAEHAKAMKQIIVMLQSWEATARRQIESLWEPHEQSLMRQAESVDTALRDLARQAERAGQALLLPSGIAQARSKKVKEAIKRETEGAERLKRLAACAVG